MKNVFKIRICSDLDYEEMVADICYENFLTILVTQEKGIDKMEIEILSPSDGSKLWSLPLDDFIESIKIAKSKLIEMQKNSDD